MLQAIIRKGKVNAEEVPAPVVQKGRVLIRVINSCISAGTEMAGVASTGKSPVRSMLEQPEKIKKVIDLLRSEGLVRLTNQYKFIKESGQPTGYSVSGIVIGVGEEVDDFKIGDKVAAAGGGFAFHAEFVEVPVNLVSKMPEGIGFEESSTVAVGAISLHGVRRLQASIGEICVVMGTGILGLLAVQMLVKSGIRVIAIDIAAERLDIAASFGAEHTINSAIEDPVKAIENITHGVGADGVLFSAATSDSKPLSQAFRMCRKKGKVVLMGVSGMQIDRKDVYPGELDFLISTSYGPGRYDKNYEEGGIDYPVSYVRWSEGRNFKEYLRLISTKQVVLDKLIFRSYPIKQAEEAFASLNVPAAKPLIVLLDYGIPGDPAEIDPVKKIILNTKIPKSKDKINIGLLGVGNFAQSVHLPNLLTLRDKFTISALASQTGVKALNASKFYNAGYATTEYKDIITDPDIDLVMICTRHGNHASLALDALRHGKHVFVEKPLATTLDDLRRIELFYAENQGNQPLLMVGFNRRFSPYITEIKSFTDKRIGPLFIQYRMNAGYQPADHWTHQDGGRIIGELCHIVDLMSALTNSLVRETYSESITDQRGKFLSSDNKSVILKYEDGSVASIQYIASGNKGLPKEYMEVHFDEKSIVLDDYKSLTSYGIRTKHLKSKKSEKGHPEELHILHNALTGKLITWPVDLQSLLETSKTVIEIS